MGKINCNDGCLDNYSAGCVKYTDTGILRPNIPQNTNLNDVVNIFANLKRYRPDILTPLDNNDLNGFYPTADIGTQIICTSVPIIYEKVTSTTWFSIAITLL